MTLYHGTSKSVWKQIQNEGILWGIRIIPGFNPSRCTYLATDKEEAEQYGSIIIEVDFDKQRDTPNNYVDGCWQVRVYCPIPLSRLKLVS